MHSKRRYVATLGGACSSLFVLMAFSGVIASAHAQDMRDTLAAAYENNPQLLSERAQLSATDEGVPQALSGWRPTVQITASAGYSHTNINSNAIVTSLHPTDYGAQLSQPVFRGGHTVFATKQAKALVVAERAHLESVEESVLLSAVTDYATVYADQATLDLSVNNEKVFRQQLEYTKDRFNVGEVTRTDVSQAEAALAQATAGREQAAAALEIARATFRQDVGIEAATLAAPDLVPDLPADLGSAQSTALSDNPNIVAATYARQAAKEDIWVVRSQLLPQITVNAGIDRTRDAGGSLLPTARIETQSVTANLTVPLYEAGNVYSQSRQAQDTLLQREHDLDQARDVARQGTIAAWQQMEAADANIMAFKSQIESNRVALEGVEQEANVGERTVLDILNAEQALFQSQVSLVQSQHDQLIAKFSVALQLGTLTARNLNLAVTFYDPEKNYRIVHNKWFGFGTGN